MQDPSPAPSCYSSGELPFNDVLADSAGVRKSGQNVVVSVYRTKVAGHCRSITVTWYRDVLVHGLSVAVEGSDGANEATDVRGVSQVRCKVELRPWYFWRKHGSKRFQVEGKPVDVFWDLRNAKYRGEPEPRSNYYVAVVSDEEVVLLLGDNKKDAYRKSGRPPALIDATLVARKEHVFGKKRFTTKTRLHDKGKLHNISIDCGCGGGGGSGSSSIGGNIDPEMIVKIDGDVAIHVKHLQWKFRGNQTITVDKTKVELYWDVHDWLFSPGPRPALFIFKLSASSSPSSKESSNSATSSSSSLSSIDAAVSNVAVSSGFCLFLYAWKVE